MRGLVPPCRKNLTDLAGLGKKTRASQIKNVTSPKKKGMLRELVNVNAFGIIPITLNKKIIINEVKKNGTNFLRKSNSKMEYEKIILLKTDSKKEEIKSLKRTKQREA